MKKLTYLIILIIALGGCVITSTQAQTSVTDSAAIADTSGQGSLSTQAPADTAQSIYPVTPERRELLNKYSRFDIGWDVFYSIFGWLLLIVIAFSGASAAIWKWSEGRSAKRWVQFLIFVLAIMVITTIVTLPLDLYRGYFVEHQYGLSSQSIGGWFGDWLKAFPIDYIISAIAFAFLYFLIRKFTRRWWLYFSLGAIPFIIFMMIIVPVVIAPIFNKFEPLKNEQLKTEILDLAGRAGINGAKVFQVDASKQSNKLNAYVTGLFNTKRIVLYDTIIKALTPKELLFVTAHEMGHYVLHHVWYGVAMIIVLIFILTWIISWALPALIRKYQTRLQFDDMRSYASLPLIMLVVTVIGFFIQPATNGVARYFEHQADKYGIVMTNYDSADAKVAFEKLSAYNLADPNPNPIVEFWFYNHPALEKRIAFVEGYKGK
jgi:Zn-dependent protease with chaperone function